MGEIKNLKDKFFSKIVKKDYNNILEEILSNKNYSLDKITNMEKEIIDTIIKLLKNKSVSEISELSHKEDGWKKTKRLEKISFDYATNLKIIK